MIAPKQPGLLAELDQLTAGIARGDEAAINHARCVLAVIARDAGPNLLLFVFKAIAEYTEE